MSNVLNPETESTTLNTELETPTLEPATEQQQQPSFESTSNPETAEAHPAESPAMDADASTEPVAQAAPAEREHFAHTPAAQADHSADSNEDFSAALEAFEREQAAEAAAVEA